MIIPAVAANPSYGSGANPDILVRVPITAKLVVDVGCGAGALGQAIRRRNPATRVIGAENDPALATRAEQVLDEVQRLDIERTGPDVPPGSVDCLIYGDVLEHLRDPWSVLRRDVQLLSDDGVLIACVPNVENWRMVGRLLSGTWKYDPSGLFDATHLRWFSRETLTQAFLQAGLNILDITPRIFDRPAAEDFTHRMEPALRAIGVDPGEWLKRSAPLQYVIRATRSPPKRMTVVARTLRPQAGINDVRIYQPLTLAGSIPGVEYAASTTPRVPMGTNPDEARVFIVQRQSFSKQALPALREMRETGALLIGEFDDDPSHFKHQVDSNYLSLRAMHAIQTSTETLAGFLRTLNPEVRVFRNGVETLPSPANFARPDQMKIFFGALNRANDIAPFIPALNQVLAEGNGRLGIEVVHDQRVFDALKTTHKRFTPTCNLAEYRAVMARCEIAFLPLAENRFNSMKSDLKYVEASAHRLISIASPCVYGQTIRHGKTGLIVQEPGELAGMLRSILAHPQQAAAIANAARAYVSQERMLAPQAAARIEWYRELWGRREKLNDLAVRRIEYLSEEA